MTAPTCSAIKMTLGWLDSHEASHYRRYGLYITHFIITGNMNLTYLGLTSYFMIGKVGIPIDRAPTNPPCLLTAFHNVGSHNKSNCHTTLLIPKHKAELQLNKNQKHIKLVLLTYNSLVFCTLRPLDTYKFRWCVVSGDEVCARVMRRSYPRKVLQFCKYLIFICR
jgi:hypothetical protein